jgi:hypothetical protein
MTAGTLRGDWPRTSRKVRESGAIALGAVVLVAVGWAVANGSRLYADAEQQMAVEVTAENRDVCQRLGAPSTGSGSGDCAQELDRVRQRHEERVARRSAGLL